MSGKAYVDKTEPSSLGSDQAATPCSALTRQTAFPNVFLGLVRAKQPSNLTRRDANISGRNICVSSNMPAELPHEGDAEFADLIVRFAFGIEVRSPFAPTDVH